MIMKAGGLSALALSLFGQGCHGFTVDGKTALANYFITGNIGGDMDITKTVDGDVTYYQASGQTQNEYGFSVAWSMNKFANNYYLDGIFLLGNNFENNGVGGVGDSRWKTTYLETWKAENFRHVPFFPIVGSKDYHGDVRTQVKYRKHDPTQRWSFPKLWYDMEILNGDVQFIFIDTLLAKGKAAFDETPELAMEYDRLNSTQLEEMRVRQYEYIASVCARSEAKYLIISGFNPIFNSGQHASDKELYTYLYPIIKKYAVSAYFASQDTSMMELSMPSDPFPTRYLVMGQGNKPYHGDSTKFETCTYGCEVDYVWLYEKGNLGAWGMLNIYSDALDGDVTTRCLVKYINAENNDVLREIQLPSRENYLAAQAKDTDKYNINSRPELNAKINFT